MFKKLFNNISNTIQSGSKKGYTNGWQNFSPGKYSYGSQVYKSYSYACINARAENVAKARIYLKRKTKSGYEEIKEHKFLDIMNKPNDVQQSFEILLFLISASLDIYGNAYLFVKRNKNPAGAIGKSLEPEGLYFLPYPNTRIEMNEENNRIRSYEYSEGTVKYKIPAEDVIHFTVPSPMSNIQGRAIASAFNFTLEIDFFQNLFQKSFYENNASIGLILECDDTLNDEQFERLETRLQQKYTGADKSGKPLILEDGLKASSYKPSVKDVEMLPARKLIRDEILAIYRVPKVILGILEDVNYAGSREAYRVFNEYTIYPFAKICIESKLNIFLRENFSEDLKLVMEYEFETDRKLQLEAYEIYRKYDIASVEEIRELEGFGKQQKIKNQIKQKND